MPSKAPHAPRTARFAALLLALAAPALAGAPEVLLETGAKQHREELDAMSYRAFDGATLDGLTGWTNGAPVTAASIAGKPVLLVSWASWYRTSHDGVKKAQELYQKNKDKGLIVVGVHHQRGFENAPAVAQAQGVAFPYAHDAEGKFRAALKIDADPDFYLIDRAGRLRYADVQTASLEGAVEELVTETAEQAAAAKAPEKPAPGENPTDAAKPDAAAYAAATWPAHTPASRLRAKNLQGKPLPAPLPDAKLFLDEVPATEGKVVLIDFWATWCVPCIKAMPKLESLQAKHEGDLVVIGLSNEKKPKVTGFLAGKPHKYAQAVDSSGTLYSALAISAIPHVIVVSSDGVIRWQGNPYQPEFEQIVADVIAADPMVQAGKKG